jgi:hypothetical protein
VKPFTSEKPPGGLPRAVEDYGADPQAIECTHPSATKVLCSVAEEYSWRNLAEMDLRFDANRPSEARSRGEAWARACWR